MATAILRQLHLGTDCAASLQSCAYRRQAPAQSCSFSAHGGWRNADSSSHVRWRQQRSSARDSIPSSSFSRLVAPRAAREASGQRSLQTTRASSNESELEAETAALEIERLERELEVAVGAEDYSAAAGIRDRLRKLQDNEEASVIAANSMFYRAFGSRNMRTMRQIWAKEDHVICVHPGANCIQGYDMVMESWDVVLSGERRLSIEIEGVRCHVRGCMAFVTCLEVLRSQGASGRVIATNIFEKRDGRWLLVLHQGAAAPAGAVFV